MMGCAIAFWMHMIAAQQQAAARVPCVLTAVVETSFGPGAGWDEVLVIQDPSYKGDWYPFHPGLYARVRLTAVVSGGISYQRDRDHGLVYVRCAESRP